jgi:hypothetical protein
MDGQRGMTTDHRPINVVKYKQRARGDKPPTAPSHYHRSIN